MPSSVVGLETIIVPADGDPFYSPATLRGTLETIPADVRGLVDRAQIAYSWQQVDDRDSLVVGGRVSGTGPAIWFIRDDERDRRDARPAPARADRRHDRGRDRRA